jgi:hypothetical protein
VLNNHSYIADQLTSLDFHSSQCMVLFSKWLSQSIEEKHKDAIWATGVTPAILAFSSIHVSSFGLNRLGL